MRAKDIVGKTVARIVQSRVARYDTGDPAGWQLERIVFTDGTELTFGVIELGHDYAIEGNVWPAARPSGGA